MESIDILMLSGKSCGKRTVLASMGSGVNEALSEAGMQLHIMDTDTQDMLVQARKAIQQQLSAFQKPLRQMEIDGRASNAQVMYSFRLTAGGGNVGLPLRIYDIPVHWLADRHQEAVSRLAKDCQVIIIAIDTPYLFANMTEKGYGAYHEEYNKPKEITKFFKNALPASEIKDKMLLFMPVRCERYYHLAYTPQLNVFQRDYMRELDNAISSGYRELLMYLRFTEELAGRCTLAITPVLSAGGVGFLRFRRAPETGRLVPVFQEPEFLEDGERGYHPRFCEQPIIYALTYIFSRAREAPKNQHTSNKAGRRISNELSQAQIALALEVLQKKMKRNKGIHSEDGYFLIQNPEQI